MKEIGGYFDIEFSNISLGRIHDGAIRLNTARNCLEYILLANQYKKIFIPYYTCDVILEPIIKLKLEYDFYHVDKNLEPVNIPICQSNEAFLYTNYFGIKDEFIADLTCQANNLIIDNSQALFAEPIDGVDTFYSLRKFVGSPDGAFLYSNKLIDFSLEKAVSAARTSHLYKRKDVNAAFGYNDFKANDESLVGLDLTEMSASTEAFLQTYDFEKNKITRERNFLFMHNRLSMRNGLEFGATAVNGPLCYPFLGNDPQFKAFLIRKHIYSPTYWPNVKNWIKDSSSVEEKFIDNLLALPIDHRYDLTDLAALVSLLG